MQNKIIHVRIICSGKKRATTTTKGRRIQVECDEENNFNNGEDSHGLLMMNFTRSDSIFLRCTNPDIHDFCTKFKTSALNYSMCC